MKKVCLIDDDPIYRFGLRMLINASGMAVVESEYDGGYDALSGLSDRIKKGEPLPDLLILDVAMPIIDGLEFLIEMEKNKLLSYFKVVVNSSDMSSLTDEFLNYKEVISVFPKPISLEYLQSVLK